MRSSKFCYKLLIPVIAFLLLSSCRRGPEKIAIGKDNCVECKMTIVDSKFGAEIVTKKGKIYKFDDVHCLASFMERRGVEMSSIYKTVFVNYNKPDEFITVKDAEFVVSSQLKSPMGGNAAAFKNKDEAEKKLNEIPGSKSTNWATLYNILIK